MYFKKIPPFFTFFIFQMKFVSWPMLLWTLAVGACRRLNATLDSRNYTKERTTLLDIRLNAVYSDKCLRHIYTYNTFMNSNKFTLLVNAYSGWHDFEDIFLFQVLLHFQFALVYRKSSSANVIIVQWSEKKCHKKQVHTAEHTSASLFRVSISSHKLICMIATEAETQLC